MAEEKDIHEAFREWTVKTGATIHPGIKAVQLPGRGIGIVATQDIQNGVVLVKLPVKSLVTVDSPFVQDERIPDHVTVHCALATAWTLNAAKGKDRKYREWEQTWPTVEETLEAMPLLWEERVQNLLPSTTKDYFSFVQRKLTTDWDAVKSTILGAPQTEATFRYYWILVNSRCYFWDFAISRKRKRRRSSVDATLPGSSTKTTTAGGGSATANNGSIADAQQAAIDECMALCPFADYFNHSESGCRFISSRLGCSITTTRKYASGEEVTVPYGAHDNDQLLVDYGFVLENNANDVVRLDHVLLPLLSRQKRVLLEELNYLGKYSLDREGVCFRSVVALAALVLPDEVVRLCCASGELKKGYHSKVFAKLVKMLETLKEGIAEGSRKVEEAQKAEKEQMPSWQLAVVRKRWKEMDDILTETKAWKEESLDG